ncbi:MAG: RidA family protein [Pseudomonadota bacterium]
MTVTPIVPPSQQSYHDDWHFSPGLEAAGFVFLSGATGGVRQTGQMPDGVIAQSENAFATLADVLQEAGLGFDAVVDMTTYHVGLQAHLAEFKTVKDRFIHLPYPAWTAIGVSELASPGALIEIKLIAKRTKAAQQHSDVQP